MGKNIKVTGTKVGADGSGYFRGSDGKYYYGHPQNGYLTETTQSRQAHSQPTSSDYSRPAGYSGGGGVASGGIIEYLLAGATSVVFLAGLAATFIIGAIVSCVMVWPMYIGQLVDYYASGRAGLAVIVMSAIMAILIGYFVVCACQVFATKRMRSKHYLLVCTLLVIAASILLSILYRDPVQIVEYAIEGVFLGIFPSFLLCFVEHLATKEIRGDREWFITKIARLLCRVCPGHSKGMMIFGVLILLFSAMYTAIRPEWRPVSPMVYVGAGILVIIMGLLAKKKGG